VAQQARPPKLHNHTATRLAPSLPYSTPQRNFKMPFPNEFNNPQLQSRFFASPPEIRLAIYIHLIPDQIHVSCCEAGLRLSPCVQRESDDHADCVNQGKNDEGGFFVSGHTENHPIYVRRLQLSWGAHWRCEEAILGLQQACDFQITMAPLFVCKRMSVCP
jgi:hypothetical protein